MTKINLIPGIFFGALTFLAYFQPSVAETTIAPAPKLQSFEFLGCSGEWSEADLSPSIWRMSTNHHITFLVRHSADCGLDEASNPQAKLTGNTIDLSYKLTSSNNYAIACFCEYWAKFTFGAEAYSIKSATFNGEPALLKGDLANGR